MSKMKRVNNIIQGLLMLGAVVLLGLFPEDGYAFVVSFLGIGLLVYGINQLLYYFTLAKYMVGGGLILCKSLLVLNLGIHACDLTDVPKHYVMIYLVATLIFGGLIDVLHALDTRKRDGVMWKLKLSQGLITIILAVTGLFFISSTRMVVYFYCFGIVSAALTKITEAFRKSAVVYIA